MSFLTKDTIHTALVDSLYSDLLSGRSRYYYFIGKVLPYSNESTPDDVLSTSNYEYSTRNDIIAVKRIRSFDTAFVVDRVDWTSGTVYDQYDGSYSPSFLSDTGASSIKTSRFYVLTDDFNVYKCLYNNNGIASTYKPTGVDYTTFTTSDGYVWKYLYTIPLSLRTKFLTSEYMPVTKSVFDSYYSNGSINKIIIDSSGSGYYGNLSTTLTVSGEFKGAAGNSIANLVPVLNAVGSIVGVKIVDAGNNYTSANISINGIGSSFYKNLTAVTISNPGSGYLNTAFISNTTASIVTSGSLQPTTNAFVELSFNNNSLVSVTVVSPGEGYDENVIANTSLTLSTAGSFQPTTNASALLNFANSAILTPHIKDGKIYSVTIDDPGVGYEVDIATTLSLIGDGTGANLVPYVNSEGELEDVIIQDGGEGYTYLDIEVVGDGTGANVRADVSVGDLESIQSIVELSAVSGAIHTVRIDNAGLNYNTGATLSVVGDGTGFSGIVNVDSSNSNSISSITVVNPGSGYTFANLTLSANTTGSGALLSAIFPPQNGHGRDAIRELFADKLMFYSTINNDKLHNIVVNNDYRQFGIIKDVKAPSNKLFGNTIGTPCFLVTVDTVVDSYSNTIGSDVVLDLVGDTKRKFQVIEVVGNTKQLLLNSINNYTLQEQDVLNDPLTDTNYTILTINQSPSINKFSGDLLFIDNRTKVSYSDQQLVTLRTVLKL